MRLFHGTATYNRTPIIQQGLRRYPHHGKIVACCSVSLEEAGFFALRKTPISDLSQTGIVIEFEGNLVQGEFIEIDSRGLLRNEREIAVLNTEKLQPVAVWKWRRNGWQQEKLIKVKKEISK